MGRPHAHGCGRRRRDLDLDLEVGDLEAGHSGHWLLLLKYLTRLLFVTLLTSSAVVLVVAVLLLSHCRERVKVVEEVVEASHGQCSPLPIPAYFACVVVVIAVFGFGCVGRKVSGLLLMAVSVVAMVIAVVVVVTEECPDDAWKVQRALVAKLEQCGLYRTSSSSSSFSTTSNNFTDIVISKSRSSSRNSNAGDEAHRTYLQQIEYLSDPARLVQFCKDTTASIRTLCPRYLTTLAAGQSTSNRTRREPAVADQLMNQTGVEACAKEVSSSMYSLCMQDTEIVFPILLTLPIFYMGIGVALVFIKHAHLKVKAKVETGGWSARTRNSVATNTERSCSSRESSSSGRRMLSRWLSSLCASHSCCFTCLLRGTPCSCCSTPSSLRPSSRLSFQLREVKDGCVQREEDGEDEESGEEGEEEGASLRMLRTASPPELREELQLMDDCL